MKVAIVQDWLTESGGAEHVFSAILDLYPNADIYTLVSKPELISKLGVKPEKLTESFIALMPFGRKRYRNYLAYFPRAIESFDLSAYDIVISSSSCVAKGVLTNNNQIHICYCHSPVRYAWDLYHQYLNEANLNKGGLKSMYAKRVLHKLRIWDVISANRVDAWVANSHYIQKRITKVYRTNSEVIYPPVNIDKFNFVADKEEYYFTASRLVPYKKIDIIVEAFKNMPNKQLIVAGMGPDYKKISKNLPSNVSMLGYVSDNNMIELMQKAKAFVFAANEDFGIIPVEAQACGTPVLAYGVGGSLETVKEGETGFFFKEQTADAIVECINYSEDKLGKLDKNIIRKHAESFSTDRFKQEFKQLVDKKYFDFINS